MTVKAMTK